MLAVAVGNAADESGDNDLRPLLPHGEHGIVEHAVVSPLLEGFLLRLGEAEVGFRAPQLLCADSTRRP